VARDDRRHGLVHVLSAVLRAAVAAAIAAAGLVLLAPAGPAGAAPHSQPAVTFRAAFGDGARLGASTAMTVSGTVDPQLSPLTSLRILTPPGIDLASTGLGIASCRRPAEEIAAVLIAPTSRVPCPQDSLMGTGSANAALMVEPQVSGSATLTLHAADAYGDNPGLVVIADTYNPARFHLTYQGYLYVPPNPFGVGVAILVPQIPSMPFGVPIALTRFRLNIGDPHITYNKTVHGHTVHYHPRAITLPQHCPKHGLRFRLIARFQNGARQQADAVARCPRS
jgi:hypothetical protein